MRIYFGTIGWGWRMYGIGYKTKWFLGFSMAVCAKHEFRTGLTPDNTTTKEAAND